MLSEVLVTSAPTALQAGRSGFATVLRSRGLHPELQSFMEACSGYRHLFPQGDPRNPAIFTYTRTEIISGEFGVFSRVLDCGSDYSGRSNKLAHHFAAPLALLRSNAHASPPVVLQELRSLHLFAREWNGPPREVDTRPDIAIPEHRGGLCESWGRVAGDPGWAGVLADRVANRQPVWLLLPDLTDALTLLQEAFALIPPRQRWTTSFTTYALATSGYDISVSTPDTIESQTILSQHPDLVLNVAEPPLLEGHSRLIEAARGNAEMPWRMSDTRLVTPVPASPRLHKPEDDRGPLTTTRSAIPSMPSIPHRPTPPPVDLSAAYDFEDVRIGDLTPAPNADTATHVPPDRPRILGLLLALGIVTVLFFGIAGGLAWDSMRRGPESIVGRTLLAIRSERVPSDQQGQLPSGDSTADETIDVAPEVEAPKRDIVHLPLTALTTPSPTQPLELVRVYETDFPNTIERLALLQLTDLASPTFSLGPPLTRNAIVVWPCFSESQSQDQQQIGEFRLAPNALSFLKNTEVADPAAFVGLDTCILSLESGSTNTSYVQLAMPQSTVAAELLPASGITDSGAAFVMRTELPTSAWAASIDRVGIPIWLDITLWSPTRSVVWNEDHVPISPTAFSHPLTCDALNDDGVPVPLEYRLTLEDDSATFEVTAFPYADHATFTTLCHAIREGSPVPFEDALWPYVVSEIRSSLQHVKTSVSPSPWQTHFDALSARLEAELKPDADSGYQSYLSALETLLLQRMTPTPSPPGADTSSPTEAPQSDPRSLDPGLLHGWIRERSTALAASNPSEWGDDEWHTHALLQLFLRMQHLEAGVALHGLPDQPTALHRTVGFRIGYDWPSPLLPTPQPSAIGVMIWRSL